MSVLTLGALTVYQFVPTVSHSQAYASQRTRAVQFATRMVENLQMLSAANLNASTLTQLQLVDAGQSGTVLSFSHIPLDESTRYSPSTALPKGTGTLTLKNLSSGAVGAQVVITWKSPYGTRSYTTGTVVGGYR
ncbi:MAG: hypothetical protein JSS66_09100 [Armatimonadetes bacterium]|nr:hypothetical protein [Armatimonadota bacterium]